VAGVRTKNHSVIILSAGAAQSPPVWFCHGLGGTASEFLELAKQIRTSREIYGIQAKGSDGADEPCATIKDMAQFHIEAIRGIRPQGPYILFGYSLGGLVALEMARSLQSAGETVPLLGMIDSYPPLRYAPATQQLRVFFRKTIYGFGRLARDRPQLTTAESSPVARRVEEQARKALRNYQPRYYCGRVCFVKARAPLHFPDDPGKAWGAFLSHLEVKTVPGDHHELLTKYSANLAEVISRYLGELD
jgi:acetoacetyl-CoA synthetase